MGLSNYQGTSMTIHYAKKKYDDTKLSKQEIITLVKKYGWKYVKKNYYGYDEEPKTTKRKKVIFYGSNRNDVKVGHKNFKAKFDETNGWESVQERSNEIAMNRNIKNVEVGDQIKLLFLDDNDEVVYKLVENFTPNNGNVITSQSPIGKAIIYHNEGDIIEVNTIRGKTKVKIIEIKKINS